MGIFYYFSFTGIAIALTSAILGLFVYYRNPKNIVNQTYALFNLSVFFWAIGYIFWPLATDKATTLYWFRVLHIGAIFVPLTFFHFTISFLGINRKFLVKLGYLLGIFFLAFDFSPLFIIDMRPISIFKFWGVPGPIYHLYLIMYHGYAFYACYLLYKEFISTSDRNRKNQLKYMFIGMVMGYCAGSSNYILFYKIPIPPFANILGVAYIAMAAYAIVAYQLMDIEVIVKKTLVFAGLLAAVFAMLILPTLIIQEYLFRGAGVGGRIAGLVISGAIIILSMRRIENFLINVTDKYLFQKKYDYKELLKTFTQEVLTILDLKALLDTTVDKLLYIMKINSASVKLFDSYSKEHIPGISLKVPTRELIVPLKLHDELIGELKLGRKKSDEDYTRDDLDILLPLAQTLAIAISNAKLFEELGKTQVEVAQKEKMAVIGTLAAGMAHEIRNPITTIKIFSEYLPDKLKEPEFIPKYKNIVLKEVDKIDHIIQTMIDFSIEEAQSKREDVSLKDAVDELLTLASLDKDVSKKIEFVNNIPTPLPNIKVNKKEFDEILLNLCQNSIHAIEDKGVIKFDAEEKDGSIQLSIIDNGRGMSEDILKNIFSPFFTTKSKGFGLGLFIVKELVKRNGGKISVESGIGKGTKFSLEFQI